jgi:hypothetical protein
MNSISVEVRDLPSETVISTGTITEMGPIFSPPLPQELHELIAKRLKSHSVAAQLRAMKIDLSNGTSYHVVFGSN